MDDITPTSPLHTRLTKLPADLFLVTRRAASLGTRRTVKQQWQAGWLLRAVTCIDLTTLAGDDTETNVARLCLKVTRVMMMKMIMMMKMMTMMSPGCPAGAARPAGGDGHG